MRKWLVAVGMLLAGCVVLTAVGIYRYVPDDEGVTADALAYTVWLFDAGDVFLLGILGGTAVCVKIAL